MEELANAVTHGIGLALSILGAVLLIVAAAWSQNAWAIVSCCVYAATLVSHYAASLRSKSQSRRGEQAAQTCAIADRVS